MKTLKHTFGNSLKFQTTGNSFMRKIFLGFLILFFSTAGYAQDPQWKIFNTSNSGLADNYINDLAIDQNGTKWIGTDEGLVKFDGTNWWTYKTSNSGLPHDHVSLIAIDGNGSVWMTSEYSYINYGIGYSVAELVKFDGTTWTVYNSANSGMPYNLVSSIAIDDNGTVWIGLLQYIHTDFGDYTEGGLAKFDGTDWTLFDTSNSGLPYEGVSSVSIDGNGSVWMATESQWNWNLYYYYDAELVKFDGTTWTVYDTTNSGLPDNYINDIALDQSGIKWIGTDDGLAAFDGINWTIYNTSNSGLPDNGVGLIAIDANGTKWMGCAGLTSFDGTSWWTYNTSNSELPSNDIRSIAFDDNGSKWIATDNGLAVYNENGFTVGVDENKLSQNSSTRIYPNPSQGQITVDLKELSNVSINVYSLNGSRVYHQENINGPQFQFELNADAGIYILEVSTQQETQRYKLVKE